MDRVSRPLIYRIHSRCGFQASCPTRLEDSCGSVTHPREPSRLLCALRTVGGHAKSRYQHEKHAEGASARCSHLGLRIATPCFYCQQPIKMPRTHLAHCPVVFQASLARLVIDQDGDGGRSSLSGAGGAQCRLGWPTRRAALRRQQEEEANDKTEAVVTGQAKSGGDAVACPVDSSTRGRAGKGVLGECIHLLSGHASSESRAGAARGNHRSVGL